MTLHHVESADPCKCRVCRKARKTVIDYLVQMGPRELTALVRGARRLGLQIRLDTEDSASLA
jgi:hypothetical protein